VFRITFYLAVLSFLYFLTITSVCNAAILVWEKNTEDDLAGYIIYYGTSPENYTAAVDVGDVNTLKLDDFNLKEDLTYFIAVTAYDHSNNESAFSTEVDFFADDGISYSEDNCPDTYNPGQEDTYPPGSNGIGDACECEADFDCNGAVDADDINAFLTDFGRDPSFKPCTNEKPCSGDFECNGNVDSDDVTIFMEDFGREPSFSPCPDCAGGDWCSY